MPGDEPQPGDGGALERMAHLPERGKVPASTRVLDTWIIQAQEKLGMDAGRLGWLIAVERRCSCSATGCRRDRQVPVPAQGRHVPAAPHVVDRTPHQGRRRLGPRRPGRVPRHPRRGAAAALGAADPRPKRGGGHRNPGTGRQAAPLRCDRFPARPGVASDPCGGCPRRGGAGDEQDVLVAPELGHFGLPNPDFLLGIALRYQIAQTIHACTDPHDPPGARNDRSRDVVDLLLLRDLAELDGSPTHAELREACAALFAARATDAHTLRRGSGSGPRPW